MRGGSSEAKEYLRIHKRLQTNNRVVQERRNPEAVMFDEFRKDKFFIINEEIINYQIIVKTSLRLVGPAKA